MKRLNKKQWEKLLGFVPNPELKIMILQACRDEKITLAEACSRYALPEVLLPGETPLTENEFVPIIRIK